MTNKPLVRNAIALAALLGAALPAAAACLKVEVQYQGLPDNPTVKASFR
jgi:hypothetical protein